MGLWPAGGWARRLLRFGRRTLGRAPGQPFWVYGRRYALDLVWPVADLRRGERILSFLEQAGLLGRADVLWARPASIHKLLLVHGHEYLESLEEHAQLERILGFPVPPGHQDELLLSQRAMVGGTLLATRYALDHGAIAVNLGGGLHHAMAGRGQGMCVFNDVAITIAHQRSRGFDGRVLVIDLDLHDGDGTRDIFRRDRSVHTFSIHNDDLGDVDALESTSIALGPNVTDATYLEALRRSLPRVLESFRPSLVVYLAGVDVAFDDRIGNWRISAAGVLERDRFVIDLVRAGAERLPVVIALAGGYGHQAWRYTGRFLSALTGGGQVHEPPATPDLPLTEFRRRTQELHDSSSPKEGAFDFSLRTDDLPGFAGLSRTLFLGRFSLHTIDVALERVGLMARLRTKGFEQLSLEAELDHPLGETLRIVTTQPEREVLVELRVRRDRRQLPPFELLYVEWLLSQNPRGSFSQHRPRLGGQRHPGMGVLRDVASLLILVCEKLELDGLAFVPQSYALAVRARPLARFLDPADEGKFQALQELLGGEALPVAAQDVEGGRIRDAAGNRPVRWEVATMIVPTSPALRKHFDAAGYRDTVGRAHRNSRLERPAD